MSGNVKFNFGISNKMENKKKEESLEQRYNELEHKYNEVVHQLRIKEIEVKELELDIKKLESAKYSLKPIDKKIKDEQISEIKELREQGLSYSAIVKKTGWSKATVSRVINGIYD